MSDQSAPQELVIVRRRGGGEEEGHHGGVWKIAYADFMTAMMAFFLVMWLVNAADKKVLTQVASYFNPLKMSDRVTAAKGVEDMVEGAPVKGRKSKEEPDKKDKEAASGGGPASEKDDKESEKTKEKGEKGKEGEKEKANGEAAKKDVKSAAGQTDLTEQELFNDPYGVLEKLAAAAKPGSTKEAAANPKPEGGMGAAFRDPFDPDFNKTLSAASTAPEKVPPAAPQKAAEAKAASAPAKPPKEDKRDSDAERASELKERIEKAMSGLAAGEHPAVAVKATPEGLLVSLSDEFDFEMFAVGSVVPNPQLVKAMQQIAEAIGATPGNLVIRGHTDGRPFKSGQSDNWRLSSERALMSRYMLIRGGIDQKRFERIEGYADTQLRVADPLAAQNRRIEVLVRVKE